MCKWIDGWDAADANRSETKLTGGAITVLVIHNNQHPLSCALHTDTLDRGPLQLAIGFHNGGGAGGAGEVERRRDVSRMSYWLAEMSSSGEMQNRYRQQVAGSW